MTTRELDNMINRINKKADRIRNTLGPRSSLYGRTAAILTSVREFNLLKREKNRYTIKRGNAVKNLSPKQLKDLENRLIQIETQIDNRSLSSEKAELRETIRTIKGKKKLGRVTIAEYKKAEALVRSAGQSLNNALEYFYAVDPNAADRETQQAMRIVSQPGRRSFAEMRQVIELANKHLKRTTANNQARRADLEYTFEIGDQDIARFYTF